MGFQELKDRILSEARKSAEDIIKEANKKAESILEEASIEAENIKTLGLRNIERDMAVLKRQSLANIRLEIQKGILMEVQNAIEEVISETFREILESPKYFDYLLKGLLEIEFKGNEEIILSNYDTQRFGEFLFKELKRVKGDINFKIISGDIRGGFIIRGIDFDINNTLEFIFQNIRPEIEQEIGRILKEAERNANNI
ncbi:MAG: V-type ATP synthase subunit E family protein [bacterium]|nr:V-type ATP synthase subunit E family protein [bacterium]